MEFVRGASSTEQLKIEWKHPVPPARDGSTTAAATPLELNEALAVLWDEDDDRPLLVLRECTQCKDSDDALFDRTKMIERTVLLTKWFRTVRLPPQVLSPDHAFFNVFAGYQWKDRTPHFFLLAEPGAKPVAFSGTQTQGQLQKGMSEVLEMRYAKDPQKAVKRWLSVIDQLDVLDAKKAQYESQLLDARSNEGPDSDRAKKANEGLKEIVTQRENALDQIEQIRDLGLLPMSRAAFASK